MDAYIALVVSEKEVKLEIPEYHIASRGLQEQSFVVYQKVVNIKDINDSVLADFFDSQEKVEPDKYSQNKRYYRSPDHWLLIAETNSERLLIAQCHRTGIFGNVDSCFFFKKNINGYGVSYHLESSNLTLVKEFDEFLATKIESWKAQ